MVRMYGLDSGQYQFTANQDYQQNMRSILIDRQDKQISHLDVMLGIEVLISMNIVLSQAS